MLLQGGVRLLFNSQQLAKLRLQSFNDVELICTGKKMKWISLSKTAQSNHFVFVNAPEEAIDLDIKNLCPDNVLSDFKNIIATVDQNGLAQFVSYRARLVRLAQQPYTAYPYQKSFSRGPPIVS
jgi:hypothetical protein